MRKILFFIIGFLCIFYRANALFGSASELDLYKNIDTGIDELEEKMMTYESNGGLEKSGILKEINQLASIDKKLVCLDESKTISQEDFKDIAVNKNIGKIANFLKEDCSKNGKISTSLMEDYSYLFTKHYNISKETAKEKSRKMYNISKIGLFSDGIVENSGFDLIYDIEEIDKIIFATKTEYVGESNVDLGESINGLLDSLNNLGYEVMNYDNQSDKNIYKPKVEADNEINNNNQNNYTQTGNNYVCIDENNNSILNKNDLSILLGDIKKSNSTNNFNNNSEENNNLVNKIDSINDEITNIDNNFINYIGDEYTGTQESGELGYSKVKDNVVWPCENFFCINIDFIMYEHNLFGGGENITIEYLLNRSNEHLSKFAASSMLPTKMTTNLFEISLKDLNLPDIFHLNVQVETKPVPILRIEKQGKGDETEFSSKNLLERYYDQNGLDYKRRNDLVLLKGLEQEKQSAINSENLNTGNLPEKHNEYNDYINNKKQKIRIIEKAIDKKVSYGVLDTFKEQYTELDKFTISIYHYIENLHTIITKMREIPVDKS